MNCILITCPVEFRAAYEFAQRNGCFDEFASKFVHMLGFLASPMVKRDSGADKPLELNDREICARVSYDGAPHSFGFAIWQDKPVQIPDSGLFRFNGALIYAGPTSPGDGSGPSFSVDLNWALGQSPKHSWNIHT